MKRSKPDAQALRRQAREATAKLREQLDLRDKYMGDLLVALSQREEIDKNISKSLHRLQEVKMPKGDIADISGLPASEITRIMRTAPLDDDAESDVNDQDGDDATDENPDDLSPSPSERTTESEF